MTAPKQERVIVYIDGYNLYFGLKDAGFACYKWLNIQSLVTALLRPNQNLIQINYFTTLVTNDVAARTRQKTYTEALGTLALIRIHYGKFQKEKSNCKVCGNDFYEENEKMTDVSIATNLMIDYYADKFDMAMIISGDTDLIPPIKFINEERNEKRVFVAFPPSRKNDDVAKFAKGSLVIGRKNLKNSQFPSQLVNKFGATVTIPDKWK